MTNKKMNAFTLAELLMAVIIIGIIMILILPSFTKSVIAKSRMTLLKNTVSNLSNIMQREISKTRTEDVTLTEVYKNPKAFLERLDIASSGEPFASSYKTYSGTGSASIAIPSDNAEGQAKALLKNGVGIGIINRLYNQESTGIIVDLNGSDKPNMVGVDYFIFHISWNDGNGVHPGDVCGYSYSNDGGSEDGEKKATLKTGCKTGDGAACYRLVELSGFDPEYLDNN